MTSSCVKFPPPSTVTINTSLLTAWHCHFLKYRAFGEETRSSRAAVFNSSPRAPPLCTFCMSLLFKHTWFRSSAHYSRGAKVSKMGWTWHGLSYFLFVFFLLILTLRTNNWRVCSAGNIAKKNCGHFSVCTLYFLLEKCEKWFFSSNPQLVW